MSINKKKKRINRNEFHRHKLFYTYEYKRNILLNIVTGRNCKSKIFVEIFILNPYAVIHKRLKVMGTWEF